MNPASYANVSPFASAKPVPDAPVNVVGVPVILYVNLAEVPLTVDPAAAQPLDLYTFNSFAVVSK